MKDIIWGAAISIATISLLLYVGVTGTKNWIERVGVECTAQGGQAVVSGRDLVCVKEKEE